MAREISEQAKPRRKQDLNEKQLDGETILYDDAQQKVYSLNTVATVIWQLCDGERSVKEIAEQVAREFERDVREVFDDVRELIAEVAKMDLVSLQEED